MWTDIEGGIRRILDTIGLLEPISVRVVLNRNAGHAGDADLRLYSIGKTSTVFETIDSRMATAGLRETGLRVEDLLLPEKRERFAAALGESETPFDYILFAKVTTATTVDNKDSQVKYSLTLDLVNARTGASIRETVSLKKHYNRSVKAKVLGIF